MNEYRAPRFYFALPRLLAMLRGGDSKRAELNNAEAWTACVVIFGISYLYFAGLVPHPLAWWMATLAFTALAFAVLVFWLLALYMNSLILKFCRLCGLFRSLPARRGQAVLLTATTTAMALQLVQGGSIRGEIAAIWLVAVAMNLAAAVILAVRDANAVRS
jgi:hypothetical protein